MEKTKEQILITKLRKAGRRTQMGMFAQRGMGRGPAGRGHGQDFGPGREDGHCPERESETGCHHGTCRIDGGPKCHLHDEGFERDPRCPKGGRSFEEGSHCRRDRPEGERSHSRTDGGMRGEHCRHGNMTPMDSPHGMRRGTGPATMPREMILLAVLEAGEGGARQKDIAAEIGINPSSLSEQIDRLEADRYLERTANPDDRRSTLITLTEKGKARAYEVQDERRQAAAKLFGNLTDEEKDTLIGLLDKLLSE